MVLLPLAIRCLGVRRWEGQQDPAGDPAGIELQEAPPAHPNQRLFNQCLSESGPRGSGDWRPASFDPVKIQMPVSVAAGNTPAHFDPPVWRG